MLLLLCSPAYAVNLTAFAHVENIDDQTSTAGEEVSICTTDQCLQMEEFSLSSDDPEVLPVYEAHFEDYGWMPAVQVSEFAGQETNIKESNNFRCNFPFQAVQTIREDYFILF